VLNVRPKGFGSVKATGKLLPTLVVFLVAVAISSSVSEFFFGYYPALTIIAALLISSPFVYLMWWDTLS
jgi:hypothetical protein